MKNQKSLNEKIDEMGIIVVEDSPSTRSFIISSIEELNLNIFEADDGKEAIQILIDNPGKIDLVLTDLYMKKIHGDDLCRVIRKKHSPEEMPVIILSSDKSREKTLELFKAGATDFLYKPLITEELIARIKVHVDQHRMKKDLKRKNSELIELSRTKDHFLGVCSHDLKSPLSVVLGYSELLLESEDLDDKKKKMINYINESGKHLLDLVNGILDFGQTHALKGRLELSSQDLVTIVDGCIKSNRLRAKQKKIDLSFRNKVENVLILGNKMALKRVFNNLISNSIKFTNESGQIKIDIAYEDSNTIVVSVEDNGIGVPKDIIDDIFKKYTKTSRKGTEGEKGTGLGLSITKELVDSMSGQIEVRSEPNVKTVFKVILKLAD
jgi:signal transduction histidine kinase